ncbi:hypothetical protein [Crinalium epipsammum]|nr:hypothetical protein [Crinalium epipsammum]
MKAKYPNTVGHTGFQACGEEVGLLGACIKSISLLSKNLQLQRKP